MYAERSKSYLSNWTSEGLPMARDLRAKPRVYMAVSRGW